MLKPNKDYRLEIKVKNGPFLRALEGAGYATVGEFCRLTAENTSTIALIANLKASGRTKLGEWRPYVLRVAELLNTLPEDLFPPQHIDSPLAKNRTVIDIDLVEMEQLVGARADEALGYENPDDIIQRADISKLLDGALETLTDREQGIIRSRFGIGCDPMTLGEIGDEQNVGKECIRQIEAKALRKLKHPDRARDLRAAMRDITC